MTSETSIAWHEDDEFWREFTPALFTEAHLHRAPAEVEALCELVGAKPGARVLDLCCGPGRHVLELARRGFFVTGVDRNTTYLERARADAEAQGLDVELVEDDMREFSRPRGFDLAINLYTSFAYFEDPRDDRRVLDNLKESLEPGGKLVMDMMSKEVLARIFVPRDWQTLPDGTLWLQERELASDWRGVSLRWMLIRPDGSRYERAWRHRLYSAAELCDLLGAAGFVDLDCFACLDGAPYDQLAEHLVVVGHRP